MNLKLKALLLLFAGAALGLTGCQDDNFLAEGADGSDYTGKMVYLTAGISLPSDAGTRSGTDDVDVTGNGNDRTNSDLDKADDAKDKTSEPDYEYGYDYENEVRSMILVIANKEDKYVTHAVIDGITQVPSSSNTDYSFTVSGEIKYEALKAAYASGGLLNTDQTVHIYAICNYTSRLQGLFEDLSKEEDQNSEELTNWIDWVGTVEEGPSKAGESPTIQNTIWAKRSFLMTNAEKAQNYKFPKDLAGWDAFSDKEHPYPLYVPDPDENEDDIDFDTVELTPIKVERVAARIDFRDESENNNTYHLYVDSNNNGKIEDDGSDLNLIDVQLTRMALVNMSKNFYYLRRVSNNGYGKTEANTPGGFQIGGKEKGTKANANYVVDTDWEVKSKTGDNGGINANNAYNYFNFRLYEGPASAALAGDGSINKTPNYDMNNWYIDNISDVLEGSDDKWTGNLGTAGRYKIWRYVTENTIPVTDGETHPVTNATDDQWGPYSQQKTIQSTGIVFKGRILAGTDLEDESKKEQTSKFLTDKVKAALAEAAKEGTRDKDKLPTLYSYQNILYAGIEELVLKAFDEGKGAPLYEKIDKILSHWVLDNTDSKYKYDEDPGTDAVKLDLEKAHDILTKEEDSIDLTDEEKFNKLAPGAQVTVYVASDEDDGEGLGYYCYYFYWNRHNDNGMPGRMGPMEFATVRNNVYKLSVESIGQLGHPRDTSHDPDPETPETPDEDPLNYLKVKVEVLPWVVRVNKIKF